MSWISIILTSTVISTVISILFKWFNDKRIETLKANLDKTSFISKTQFDAEFKIYQELSEKSFEMMANVSELFPNWLDKVPREENECKEFYQKRFKKAEMTFITFQNTLFKHAPFIYEEICTLFTSLKDEAQKQIVWYPELVLYPRIPLPQAFSDEEINCSERTRILIEKHSEIIKELRKYLKNLKEEHIINN